MCISLCRIRASDSWGIRISPKTRGSSRPVLGGQARACDRAEHGDPQAEDTDGGADRSISDGSVCPQQMALLLSGRSWAERQRASHSVVGKYKITDHMH